MCVVIVEPHIGGVRREARWYGDVATMIEKGKETCANSPTLDEEWVQKVLGKIICRNGIYDDDIIRNCVEKILIFNECLEICCRNEYKLSIKLDSEIN